MLTVNENYTMIFPRNDTGVILYKCKKDYGKVRLEANEYALVEKIYSCNHEVSIDKDIEDELLKKCIFLYKRQYPNTYANTQYEKTNHYLTTYFGKEDDYIRKLKETSVLVVGLGGIGAGLAKHLVSVGIGKLILIDFDKVSISNLNRQFCYGYNNIGKNKTDVLKDYLKNLNPEVKIYTHNCKMDNLSVLQDASKLANGKIDIIVNAADVPFYEVGRIILQFCKERDLAYLDASTGIEKGSWLILSSENNNQKEQYIAEYEYIIQNTYPSRPCTGSIGFQNSIIVDFAARDIIFYLLDHKDNVYAYNKKALFDSKTMSITIDGKQKRNGRIWRKK